MSNLLVLDPGGTTGFVVLRNAPLLDYKSMPDVLTFGSLEEWHGIEDLLRVWDISVIVMEDFKLYPWKARQQSFSTMVAPRVIGAVEVLAAQYNISVVKQSASVGKSVTVSVGLRKTLKLNHIIDAVSHGIFYLRTQGRVQHG